MCAMCPFAVVGDIACNDESNLDNFQWYEDDGSFGCQQETEYCMYHCRCRCGEDGVVIRNQANMEDCSKTCF